MTRSSLRGVWRPIAAVAAALLTSVSLAAGEHWAYQPVKSQVIPQVQHPKWVRNPIDSFVLAKLEENQLVINGSDLGFEA